MKRLLLVLLALLALPLAAAPRKAAPHDWTRTIAETPAGGVRIGDPAAKVAVIEYGSRTCPHCAHFAAEGLPALKAKYIARGQVSYEFRDYPIHSAIDLAPILLGRCGGVRLFFPLLDAMMAQQAELSGRTAEIPAADQQMLAKAVPTVVTAYLGKFYGYLDLATKHGIAPAQARACLADGKAIDSIVARADAADRQFHIQSTPTFIINGTPAANAYDWATLEPALRAAGAR